MSPDEQALLGAANNYLNPQAAAQAATGAQNSASGAIDGSQIQSSTQQIQGGTSFSFGGPVGGGTSTPQTANGQQAMDPETAKANFMQSLQDYQAKSQQGQATPLEQMNPQTQMVIQQALSKLTQETQGQGASSTGTPAATQSADTMNGGVAPGSSSSIPGMSSTSQATTGLPEGYNAQPTIAGFPNGVPGFGTSAVGPGNLANGPIQSVSQGIAA